VTATPDAPTGRDLEAEAARLTALQRRAMDGDAGALAELRKVLDADPGWWQQTGDVAWQAENAWLRTYAGKDEFAKEATSRKLQAMRRHLRGPEASPLARLLVDRIVLNWLTLHYAESQYARGMRSEHGIALDVSTHQQERVDRCQKRYLAAIKALAQLRRLEQRGPLVAVGQVNVAEQQLNVSTTTQGDGPSVPVDGQPESIGFGVPT
jgi:hypothetical protein